MTKNCEDGSCSLTEEEYNKLNYKDKHVVTLLLLSLEEKENQVLRTQISELKKANNPFAFYYRKLTYRYKSIDKCFRKIKTRAAITRRKLNKKIAA